NEDVMISSLVDQSVLARIQPRPEMLARACGIYGLTLPTLPRSARSRSTYAVRSASAYRTARPPGRTHGTSPRCVSSHSVRVLMAKTSAACWQVRSSGGASCGAPIAGAPGAEEDAGTVWLPLAGATAGCRR